MKTARQHDEMSDAQKRRLGATCEYIDKLLCEIEQILDEEPSKSPFPRYIPDVTLAQTRVLEDHIRRIREQLLRALSREKITREPPANSATHAILTRLEFIDNAIEELKPRHMRGYGSLSEVAAEKLNGTVNEFRSAVQSMGRYLRQEPEAIAEPRENAPEQASLKIARTKAQ